MSRSLAVLGAGPRPLPPPAARWRNRADSVRAGAERTELVRVGVVQQLEEEARRRLPLSRRPPHIPLRADAPRLSAAAMEHLQLRTQELEEAAAEGGGGGGSLAALMAQFNAEDAQASGAEIFGLVAAQRAGTYMRRMAQSRVMARAPQALSTLDIARPALRGRPRRTYVPPPPPPVVALEAPTAAQLAAAVRPALLPLPMVEGAEAGGAAAVLQARIERVAAALEMPPAEMAALALRHTARGGGTLEAALPAWEAAAAAVTHRERLLEALLQAKARVEAMAGSVAASAAAGEARAAAAAAADVPVTYEQLEALAFRLLLATHHVEAAAAALAARGEALSLGGEAYPGPDPLGIDDLRAFLQRAADDLHGLSVVAASLWAGPA